MDDSIQRLDVILKEAGVPESHGMGHCTKVLEHLDKALAASELEISDDRKLAMRLGALLHDADDYKYFPKESKNGENIMR